MKIEVNKTGEIIVTKKVTLSEVSQKCLIIRVVTSNGRYKGEQGHDRWSALYNAYDMIYGTDIRSEHDKYRIDKCSSISRIEYLIKTGQVNNLLYVVSRLYKREFEKYFVDYFE